MESDDETEKVRVKFVTKIASIRVTEVPIAVPTSLGRYGLSEVVNHLLAREEPIPLEFLVEGKGLLRVPLERHLTAAGLSGETVVELEYFPAAPPPEQAEGPRLPDWVSALAGAGAPSAAAAATAAVVAAGCYDGQLRVLGGGGGGGGVRAAAAAHRGPVTAVAVAAAAAAAAGGGGGPARLLSGSKDRTVKTWTFEENNITPNSVCIGHENSVESLDFDPSGTKFASGDWDGVVFIWEVPNETAMDASNEKKIKKQKKSGEQKPQTALVEQKPIATIQAHGQSTTALVWGAGAGAAGAGEGALAATGGLDRAVKLWDMERQDCVQTLACPGAVTALARSARHAGLLAAAGPDAKVRLWDPRRAGTAAVQATLAAHRQWVSSVAWIEACPFLLASTSYDGDLKLWDIRSHIPLYTVQAHPNEKGLCVLSMEKQIFTGGTDGMVKIFSLPDNKLQQMTVDG